MSKYIVRDFLLLCHVRIEVCVVGAFAVVLGGEEGEIIGEGVNLACKDIFVVL